ncbi:hypothetical protein ABTX80_24980 [Streptomyces erythrochromogenes]|uniref:hypothetical protein n=1 Tax=Streptomyces erythrochromogenes TaxID=285574 RepID=UPI00331A9ECE
MRTKRGGIHPPRTGSSRYGEASSASRRYRDRVWDKINAADYVQLAPGVIVVFERQPWVIVEVTERADDLWGDKYDKKWAEVIQAWEANPRGERPERATWSSRPMAILIVPASDPQSKPLHLMAPAHYSWTVLPEHYSICVACGELPPCRHETAEDEADEAMAKAEVLMEIPTGACLACGEAITRRQKSQRFPGPNLWRPDLADGSAVFHARQECSGNADRYAEQWRARGGHSPQPSLFTDQPDGGLS